MSLKIKVYFTLLFIIIKSLSIESRCGYPELPFMSASIETKEFFEEGETLKIDCISSIIVGQTLNNGIIECKNNTWNSTSLRCSHVQNITAIDIRINGRQEETPDLKRQEFMYLSDNDPMTCVLLRDEEQWIMQFNSPKFVSNVALIATFINDGIGNNATNIEIRLSMDETWKIPCQLEESSNNPNSPVVLLIYKCPNHYLTENVSIHLQANENDINICGIDIFTVVDDECGKPELPLYSYANQIKIQNGTKIAEYVCAKGYKLSGSSLRTCGTDGLWHPSKSPTCLSEVQCSQFNEINSSFRFERKDYDLFGDALPDISTITYHCLNETEIASPPTVRYCQKDGNWSAIKHSVVCRPRSSVIVVFGKHISNDKHLIFYGGFGLVLLFVGSAIILFHMRRLAKKISKQMRESLYLQNDKALPNYNNDSNYQDISALFSGEPTNPAVPQVQQNEPKF